VTTLSGHSSRSASQSSSTGWASSSPVRRLRWGSSDSPEQRSRRSARMVLALRSDALDAFVFDQLRAVLLRPDLLLTGEQAVASIGPAPDDELLDAELARMARRLDAADAEHRRLVDLYQAGLIDLPQLQRRNTEVEHRRRDLTQRRDALTTQRQELTRDNQVRQRVHDFAERVRTGIDGLDFEQKQTLLRLLVEEVRVTGWHVQIQLRIALDKPPNGPEPRGDKPPQNRPKPEVSSKDSLRSVGVDHR